MTVMEQQAPKAIVRSAQEEAPGRNVYANYIVGLLLLVSIVAYADRLILGFLVNPIKADLGISDTQIGLLTGLAFSLFYAVMGIPIGRAIDLYPRPTVLAICVMIWSFSTMLSGVAGGVALLFLARCGVGAGEAAMNPAAVSIISDRYPRERVVSALSIYSIGVVAGGGLAILLGGQLIALLSSLGPITILGWHNVAVWRVVLFIVGAPGIAAALLVALTIRDPDRYFGRRLPDTHGLSAPTEAVLPLLRRKWRAYSLLMSGLVAFGFYNYAILGWYPAMFARSFGASPATISAYYGTAYLVAGVCGVLISAALARRLTARGHKDPPVRILLLCSGLALLPAVAGPLMPNFGLAAACFCLSMTMSAMQSSIAFSAFVLITPAVHRGIVIAAYVMIMNLTSASLGSVLIGLLSDHLFGPQHLNRSIALVAAAAIPIAVLCYARLGPSYRREVAAEEEMHSI